MLLYDILRGMQARGCNVSISEVKDAIEILKNVDINDKALVRKILYSTLAKDNTCKVALDEVLEELSWKATKETGEKKLESEYEETETTPPQEESGEATQESKEKTFKELAEWW